LPAHNTALRGAGAIDEHLQARLLAQSLIAQWTVSRVVSAPSQGQNGRFAWAVAVTPLAEGGSMVKGEGGHWALHDLTVTVRWAPNRHIALTTLRLLAVP
jgi:hypothetical protein